MNLVGAKLRHKKERPSNREKEGGSVGGRAAKRAGSSRHIAQICHLKGNLQADKVKRESSQCRGDRRWEEMGKKQ